MSFRVALSGGFLKPDGTPAYPDFDLSPLERDPGIELVRLSPGPVIAPEQVAGIDALILLGESFERGSIAPDGRLRIIARYGVGFDQVDTAACTEAGIAVAITPDAVRRPVAVAIITLMLALTGRLMVKDALTREGPAGFARRSAFMGVGLVGRILGSIGIGNIGAEMFRLAAPLGMRMIAHDPYADLAMAASLGVELVELDEVFERSDVLTVNCPLNHATARIVSRERIARMKRSAFLINTSRGGTVDEAALAEALEEGRLAGAGLDVFDPEPPAPDTPILQAPNVIATPHALSWTDQSFAAIGTSCTDAVLAARAARLPNFLANPAVRIRSRHFH
ncbi:NAD(P)-dependent oxidoreductase [Roseomonas sp. WA12]